MITLNNGSTTQPGTVICGTMRVEHLIPTFLDEIERLQLPSIEQRALWDNIAHYVETGNGQPSTVSQAKEWAMDLLDELFDMLDSIAPDGYYFGAHYGDGADYGWWALDRENPNYIPITSYHALGAFVARYRGIAMDAYDYGIIKDLIVDVVGPEISSISDCAYHGVSSGCGGEFIYTRKCVDFYYEHKSVLWEMICGGANEMGVKPLEFIASLNGCEVSDHDSLATIIVWYCVERICQEIDNDAQDCTACGEKYLPDELLPNIDGYCSKECYDEDNTCDCGKTLEDSPSLVMCNDCYHLEWEAINKEDLYDE